MPGRSGNTQGVLVCDGWQKNPRGPCIIDWLHDRIALNGQTLAQMAAKGDAVSIVHYEAGLLRMQMRSPSKPIVVLELRSDNGEAMNEYIHEGGSRPSNNSSHGQEGLPSFVEAAYVPLMKTKCCAYLD